VSLHSASAVTSVITVCFLFMHKHRTMFYKNIISLSQIYAKASHLYANWSHCMQNVCSLHAVYIRRVYGGPALDGAYAKLPLFCRVVQCIFEFRLLYTQTKQACLPGLVEAYTISLSVIHKTIRQFYPSTARKNLPLDMNFTRNLLPALQNRLENL
jgi:hypothetical protein